MLDWDADCGSCAVGLTSGALLTRPGQHSLALLALALAWGLSGLEEAQASSADVFGLGGEEPALAGASAARVHDFSAAYYNPAGLVRVERFQGSLGLLAFGSHLDAGGRSYAIPDPLGIVVGVAAPVPLGRGLERRLFVGLAAYVLPGSVAHVVAHTPDQPFFPYYDNRSQRLLILPSLAVRLGAGLSLGVALNILAGLNGRLVATEGATRAIEVRVDEQARSVVRANAGLLWQSRRDRLALAAVYRQAFSLPFGTRSSASLAGQLVDIDVSAEGLYSPHQLVLGALVRPRPWLALSADFTVSFWSAWQGPYVRVASTLPLAGSLDVAPPQLAFDDAFSLRLGVEVRRLIAVDGSLGASGQGVELAGRLGLGGETSPIPASQPGVTNLLDGEKLFLAAGFGLRAPLGRAFLRVDVHGQLHLLRRRTVTKRVAQAQAHPDPAQALRDELADDAARPETLGPQSSNPGYPSISGGGYVWSTGIVFTVER